PCRFISYNVVQIQVCITTNRISNEGDGVMSQSVEKGYFGQFGGSFVPPELQEVLDYLAEQFYKFKDDPEFNEEFQYYMKEYVGRENPLTFAKRLTDK